MDFSSLNHLPTDVKVLMVNGKTVVEDAKEKLQSREYRLDLTSKLQIKSDCKEVEKYIKMIASGKMNEKNKKALEVATIRLQTTVEGIIKFYTR